MINLGWLANALPILFAPTLLCMWLLRPSMISIHQHRCALLLLALRALLRLMTSSCSSKKAVHWQASKLIYI